MSYQEKNTDKALIRIGYAIAGLGKSDLDPLVELVEFISEETRKRPTRVDHEQEDEKRISK